MHIESPAMPARMRAGRSPILNRLRAETVEQHAALESVLPLQDAQLSRATYHRLLMCFWGFYAPLEARMLEGMREGVLPSQPDFDYRERLKTPKLEHDLLALGESPESIGHAPQCADLPPVSTLVELLGSLYVVEGATLGGQIIARQLQATLGLGRDAGARFFNGYGAETGPHWKATTAMLSAKSAELDEDDAIVASANATFASLGRWIAAASPLR